MADDSPDKKTQASAVSSRALSGFNSPAWREVSRRLREIEAGYEKSPDHKQTAAVTPTKPKDEPQGEVTGGGDDPKRTRKSRKPNAGLTVHGGRREMKAYTVTEDQLESLGAMQVSTTVSFSAASALVTFWIGVQQEVAFADSTPASVRGWWEGLAAGALALAALLFCLGLWQFVRGRTTIGKIKKETRHE